METAKSKIRVRIAPSPTGGLHVGTARTALFNELFARHEHGTFIVRIEDTDTARSKPEHEANILAGMKWFGLEWQEGPDIGGPYGPYRQSERGASHTAAVRQLLEEKKAYFCSCVPKKEAGRHVCTCSETITQKEGETKNLPVRLRVEPQELSFEDIVRGKVSVHTDSFGGDFIIARSLSNPLFHLAVVVDDAAMEISHVIRGEDHISNTFKHLLLQRALGYAEPVYVHLPLLLDTQRRKLSKRNSETSLNAYRQMGYLPEAMLNYLALLGWNPGDEREFFTHEELVDAFSLDKVQKGGAVFSIEKLQAINKHYLRQLSPDALLVAAQPFLEAAGKESADESLLTAALAAEQERVATLAELPDAIAFFLPDWQPDFPVTDLVWKKSDRPTTISLLKQVVETLSSLSETDFQVTTLEEKLMAWIDGNNLGRGDVLWPLRVALTGKRNSPSPFEVAAVLGKPESMRRLSLAIEKLESYHE